MTELELLKLLAGTTSSSAVAFLIIGYMFLRNNKSGNMINKELMRTIKENAVAMTRLAGCIEEFNRVNGTNQKECQEIREAMTQEVTRLAEIKR